MLPFEDWREAAWWILKDHTFPEETLKRLYESFKESFEEKVNQDSWCAGYDKAVEDSRG